MLEHKYQPKGYHVLNSLHNFDPFAFQLNLANGFGCSFDGKESANPLCLSHRRPNENINAEWAQSNPQTSPIDAFKGTHYAYLKRTAAGDASSS